ncbi:MAG TPA: AAA family ATPase, partial [Candidatus Nanopelagicales bacterium]|nr:AAA family ATPase [Candidatus Nanopelagicales bacterium]
MGQDRITEITIEGLRSIARLSLPLRGLTVLIGENGSGKSSIVEACEILRRASRADFLGALNNIHAGLFNLLRDGATELKLGIRVENSDGDPPLRYRLTIAQPSLGHSQITEEHLELGTAADQSGPLRLMHRSIKGRSWIYRPAGDQPIAADQEGTVLSAMGLFPPDPGFSRMRTALENIEVHLPFEVLPSWAARAHDRRSAMRTPTLLQPAERLERLGGNIANVYQTLRMEFGEEHWRTTMDYVRLGLGDHIESVNTRVDPGGGAIGLWVKLRDRERQLPASALADGVLTYLAFVALYRLRSARSLLVFDEPDPHLHPALLSRVIGLFEAMA